MVDVLRTLIKQVDNMQGQMGNVSKKQKFQESTKRKKLEIKNTVTKMKNSFMASPLGQTHLRKQSVS